MTDTSQCALFLCPEQHDFTVKDVSLFITQLQNTGLIDEAITERKDSYYAGERFLDYIAYMGCSPAIQFEASDTRNDFCHIKIHQYDSARLIVSEIQTRAPHCPHCSKPVKNWLDTKTTETIHCNLCDATSHISEFNWRKMAGYAQLFIKITDIFPKEAMPQQVLLDKLSAVFDTEWLYFYSCQ